jgi:hypothetical protein
LFAEPQPRVRYFSDYTKLTKEKVSRKYGKTAMSELHGSAQVREGTFLEGTAHWGGILPDIYVDNKAVAMLQKKFAEIGGPKETDPERAIDAAEKAVRLLLPEQHPDVFAEYCNTKLAKTIARDGYAKLSNFLSSGIGDCRANALSLTITLAEVEKMGLVKDIQFGNRKWGVFVSKGHPSEEVGHQGEHAICTFRYAVGDDTTTRFVADAYAVPYDRAPVGGKHGVDAMDDWYRVDTTRHTGTTHNVYRQLVRDEEYQRKLKGRMSRRGRERFTEQAKLLDVENKGKVWGYLSPTLDHPTIISPKKKSSGKSSGSSGGKK